MIQRSDIRHYIEHHLPIAELVKFLSLASTLHPDDALLLREFNLGYQKHDGSFGFSRHHNFQSVETLKAELMRRAPARIDVGGILTTETAYMPLGIHWKAMMCLEKELVIDIDVDDYDDIRSCPCKSTKAVCASCWGFLAIAAKSVDFLLRFKFGCTELFWVFSGRRGVHCWVLDKAAARYSEKYRRAIVQYFNPFEDKPDHRSYVGRCKLVRKLYDDILEEEFGKLLLTSAIDLSAHSASTYIIKAALAGQPKPRFTHALLNATSPGMSNTAIWNQYKIAIRDNHPKADPLIMSIVLSFIFPRLDAGVSINRKHLIKCPFSWHPRTGNVCVPFQLSDVHKFDLSAVPNIKNWNSFDAFQEWRRPLDLALLDTGDVAKHYVCMECVDLSRPLREIPVRVIFNMEESWHAHTRASHPQTTYTPDNSRLSDLVKTLCAMNGNVDYDIMRAVFYNQLESLLGRDG